MSIIKRHFPPTFIAPKYDSLQYVMKISEVLLSCYVYTTNQLSVKTHSNHLISDTKGDSFIDNYLYLIDSPFFSSKKGMSNLNIFIDKLTLI